MALNICYIIIFYDIRAIFLLLNINIFNLAMIKFLELKFLKFSCYLTKFITVLHFSRLISPHKLMFFFLPFSISKI